MTKCSGITQAGTACKGIPIDGSGYCYVHHPDHAEDRRRHGAKGGKRGGRGRPTSELARLGPASKSWRIRSSLARWSVPTGPSPGSSLTGPGLA